MLVSTLTGGLSVDILTLKTETFDNFVLEAKNLTKEVIQKQLEKSDKEIYIRIDHERTVTFDVSLTISPSFISMIRSAYSSAVSRSWLTTITSFSWPNFLKMSKTWCPVTES